MCADTLFNEFFYYLCPKCIHVMRRRYFIYLLISLLTFPGGCKDSESGSGENSGGGTDPDNPGGKVVPGLVFSATIPEGYPLPWKSGDKIAVNGALSGALADKDISPDGRTAGFTVSVDEAARYDVVFPAGAYVDGEVVFPAKQACQAEGYDPAALILSGRTSSRTVNLEPQYALLEVKTAAGSGPRLTGLRAESFGGEKMGGNDHLEMDAPEGGLAPGASLRLCIPAQLYSNGLHITLFAADGTQMSFSRTGEFDAAGGQHYEIPAPAYVPTLVSLTSLLPLSSSSVALTWTGIDAAVNGSTVWLLHIYDDSSCTTPLRSLTVSGALSASGDCGYAVGGLDEGRDYWFKVENSSDHSASEEIPVTMPSFTRVPLSGEVSAEGLVLSEDFSSSVVGEDLLYALPGVTEGLPQAFSDIADLAAWASVGNVSFHPGYVATSNRIITPPVAVADGKKISADVTLKLACSPDDASKDWAVFVVPESNLGGWTDTDNQAKYRSFSLSGGAWEEITVSGLTVANGQRIAVGLAEGGSAGTLLVSEMSVRATGISSIFASLTGSSSSTLSFSWTEGGSAADDARIPFFIGLYDDPACSNAIQSYNLAAGACGSGSPRFVFSGLEGSRTSYFKVEDTAGGFVSEAVQARTESFSTVRLSGLVSGKGIALAEDFSELRWDSDPMTKSAGYRPSGTGSFANGPGTFVPYGSASAYLLKQQTTALPGSRLDGWASDSDVYIHPGMLQIGKSGGKGWIFTPEFHVRSGGNLTVNVTINASSVSNTSSGVWCIAVLDRANANVTGYSADFNHHPDAGNTQKIQFFTLDRPGQWQKLSAEGLVVEDGDRIMFGVKGSYTASGDNCRALIKDFTVEVTDIFAPEDPLTFADGTPVSSPADWALRREEIKEIFQREMYGEIPAPMPVYVDRIEHGNTVVNGVNAVREQYRMWFREDRSGLKVDWLVVRPRSAPGPVPVILTYNYWGNHLFIHDPEVVITDCWMETEPAAGISGHSANPDWRGRFLDGDWRYAYPLDDFLRRGYALVTACYAEVAPDPETVAGQKELSFTRVFDLWGPRDPSRTDNPMTLGAWAWGLMRAMDMIEDLPALDATKVMVTGCSRLGKTSLITAAFDERFALCAPVQTGSGGVPMTKHITPDKESIASETSTYTTWFCPKYATWAGREGEMPFDQHLLLSLVAPRPLLVLGFNNLWFDAYGEFLSVQAASPVWDFLGKDSTFGDSFPDTGASTAIGPNLGYARRDGAHGVIQTDWDWILAFAESHLK